MRTVKSIAVNLLTLLAVAAGLLLAAVGYSDRLPPQTHPLVACAGMAMPAALALDVAMLLVMLAVRWKRAWIPLAACAATYAPIRNFLPLHFTDGDAEGPETLRVMTYNVCGYGGNSKYEHGLDTVTAYVMAHRLDVVCTQEEHCKKFDTVGKWKKLYPYNDTTVVGAGKAEYANTMGIHTRLPIVKKETIDYESGTNGSVAYFLLWGGDTVVVVNNHLESTHLTARERTDYQEILKGNKEPEEAEMKMDSIISKLAESMVKRAPEAQAVHKYVEEHRKRHPVVVCGDFNDTPISYTRRTVAQGLTDCFAEAGCGLGLSYNRKGFNLRIDHIFCSQQLTPVWCKVDSKMDASDHYPMLCTLKKNNKP